MATNQYSKGNNIDYTATTAVKSGDVVVVGDTVGIALCDIANNQTGAVAVCGAYELKRATTSGIISQGAKIYATNAGNATTTATNNTYAGNAHVQSDEGQESVVVRLSN